MRKSNSVHLTWDVDGQLMQMKRYCRSVDGATDSPSSGRGQGGVTEFEGVSPSTDAVRNHQIKTIASKEDTTELT